MTLKNATRWIRVLSLFGLVFAIACESDLTNPEREAKPLRSQRIRCCILGLAVGVRTPLAGGV